MKTKIVRIFLYAFLTTLTACSTMSAQPRIDIAIENKSSKDIENARVRFGKYECAWGYVSVGAEKIYGRYTHLITMEAELHWDVAGRHKEQKFDLNGIYTIGKSGRLTVTVFGDRAEVDFREEK